VGIVLGFILLQPSDAALRLQEVRFSHHLRPSDAGWAVVLYLWLLVSGARLWRTLHACACKLHDTALAPTSHARQHGRGRPLRRRRGVHSPQVARAVSIGVFFPLLSSGRVGYALTWQTATFMVWAGLRGAVRACVCVCVCVRVWGMGGGRGGGGGGGGTH
jgi:hypothetical protein